MAPPNDTQWKTWRVVTSATDDVALLSDFKPSNYNATLSRTTLVYPAMALRAFGRQFENQGTVIEITGWMLDKPGGSVGPGQSLLRTEAFNGAKTLAGQPLADGSWANATWFEVEDWIKTGVDHNAANATVMGNVAGSVNQATLLLPLHGYNTAQLNIQVNTAEEFGVMYRYLTAEEYASNATLV